METTVGQVLARKSSQRIYAINADDLVVEALRVMARHDVGALVVTEGYEVVGLVSERDYARKVALRDRSSRSTAVREIMSKAVYVLPHVSIDACRTLMTERRLRYVCVADGGQLQGVLSLGDAVKEVASDQAFMIDQLTWYITGSSQSLNLSARSPRLPDHIAASAAESSKVLVTM